MRAYLTEGTSADLKLNVTIQNESQRINVTGALWADSARPTA